MQVMQLVCMQSALLGDQRGPHMSLNEPTTPVGNIVVVAVVFVFLFLFRVIVVDSSSYYFNF